VFELAGAVGLLIPKATRYAILGLTGIMFGAAYTHLTNHEGTQIFPPFDFSGRIVGSLVAPRHTPEVAAAS
jgi:uncharacterized membrane protein YphA (DoxX/SURF4 family)